MTHVIVCAIGAVLLAGAALAPDLNPAVTPTTIRTTICRAGYTKTVRPPVAWSDAKKRELMRSLRLPGRSADYELDHRVPLELGGHPRCACNLRMQPRAEAKVKDPEENRLHHEVCQGRMTLGDAQQRMRDWKKP